jgi:predicted Zn-dependent protease
VLAVALTAALGALLPLTMGQIDTWRDSRTLFRHAYANVPNNYLAATFLGQVERRAGELSAARAHFETALAANKYHVPAMVELGLTLEDLGELGAARKALKRALRNDPASAPARAALERVERLLEGREEG